MWLVICLSGCITMAAEHWIHCEYWVVPTTGTCTAASPVYNVPSFSFCDWRSYQRCDQPHLLSLLEQPLRSVHCGQAYCCFATNTSTVQRFFEDEDIWDEHDEDGENEDRWDGWFVFEDEDAALLCFARIRLTLRIEDERNACLCFEEDSSSFLQGGLRRSSDSLSLRRRRRLPVTRRGTFLSVLVFCLEIARPNPGGFCIRCQALRGKVNEALRVLMHAQHN